MGSYTGGDNGEAVLEVETPDDGTTIEAGDVNVPFETLLDNDAYFAARVGNYRLIEVVGWSEPDAGESDASFRNFASTSYVAGTGGTSTLATADCEAGDILLINMAADFTIAGGDSAKVRITVDDGTAGAYIEPSGGRCSIAAAVTRIRVAITCIRVIANAGTRTVRLEAKSSAGNSVDAIGAGAMIVQHFRSNA